MVSNCPECGARLDIVRARDSTEALGGDVSSVTPQQYEQPKDANSLIPDIDTTEVDLQRLKELICAPTKSFYGPRPRTMRPDLSDEATLQDKATQEALSRVASQMHSAIRHAGEKSVDTLLESKRDGRDEYDLPAPLEWVLEAVGAILYEQERAGSAVEEMQETEPAVAEDIASNPRRTRDSVNMSTGHQTTLATPLPRPHPGSTRPPPQRTNLPLHGTRRPLRPPEHPVNPPSERLAQPRDPQRRPHRVAAVPHPPPQRPPDHPPARLRGRPIASHAHRPSAARAQNPAKATPGPKFQMASAKSFWLIASI
ncbi:hypothetical protein C8A00DRAFT_32664 [Chaetomidium leptoderma]|uniref:Uncharacterized protein n=1 Tax=Chaetomidium leptoderma TaxID=669021 RepID=A0AAN6VNJ0_9PEZI|nr:hypothetical protein C8A00DRAFT_32664 [Chaetomidium leptoderma]